MQYNRTDQKPHTWTPRYKVETQCGWKPPAASCLYLSLIRNFSLQYLYWCSLVPVHRLQPAEGYNLLSFSKLPWKGAPTPFALVLAKILVCRCWPTIFFLSGTTFHTFSDWIFLKHNIQSVEPNSFNFHNRSMKHKTTNYITSFIPGIVGKPT